MWLNFSYIYRERQSYLIRTWSEFIKRILLFHRWYLHLNIFTTIQFALLNILWHDKVTFLEHQYPDLIWPPGQLNWAHTERHVRICVSAYTMKRIIIHELYITAQYVNWNMGCLNVNLDSRFVLWNYIISPVITTNVDELLSGVLYMIIFIEYQPVYHFLSLYPKRILMLRV